MMGDPVGSSRVSSQKQNREGVARAQSGQYRAMAESSQGRDGGPDHNVTVILCVIRIYFNLIVMLNLKIIN